MPHTAGHPQLGATAIDDGTDNPQTFNYDLYSLRRNTPDLGGKKLQDVYGRGSMPSYQWLETIKTGEATYTDTSAADRAKLKEALEDFNNAGGDGSGLENPMDIIKAEVGPVLAQVAGGVGSSLATGGTALEGLPFTQSGMDYASGKTFFDPKLITPQTKTLLNTTEALSPAGLIDTKVAETALGGAQNVADAGGIVGRDAMTGADLFGEKGVLNPFGAEGTAGAQNFRSAAGGAVGNFAVQLALGQDPVKAAKSAGAGAIGKFIGSAFGPIGGFIGGALGSMIGGRVICNELHNQGLITKKQLVNDYKFTRDYLTPAHVNGYHLWALWMVKQMRKGKYVKFWKHIVLHRANEISYIYGETEKPDYLGKVYRKIFEPVCWSLGLFCKKTDWSVLYKQKEI